MMVVMVHGRMAPAEKLLTSKLVQPAAFAKPGPGSHEKSRRLGTGGWKVCALMG
jgi:hypothetical protein